MLAETDDYGMHLQPATGDFFAVCLCLCFLLLIQSQSWRSESAVIMHYLSSSSLDVFLPLFLVLLPHPLSPSPFFCSVLFSSSPIFCMAAFRLGAKQLYFTICVMQELVLKLCCNFNVRFSPQRTLVKLYEMILYALEYKLTC